MSIFRRTVGPPDQYEHVAQFKDGHEVTTNLLIFKVYIASIHSFCTELELKLISSLLSPRLSEPSPKTNGKLSPSTQSLLSRR